MSKGDFDRTLDDLRALESDPDFIPGDTFDQTLDELRGQQSGPVPQVRGTSSVVIDNMPANGESALQAPVKPLKLDGKLIRSAPENSSDDTWLAFAEGMGHGGAARLGVGLGETLADASGFELPEGAEVRGGDVIDNIQPSGLNTAARLGGRMLTGIPAMIAAGPGVGAQAALGAGLGALDAGGEKDADLASVLAGSTIGGALGATGGLAMKGARYAGEQVPGALLGATRGGEWARKTMGSDVLKDISSQMALPGKAIAAGVAKGVAAYPEAVGQGARALAQTTAAHSSPAARVVGKAGESIGKAMYSAANAEDSKAYSGIPTTSWAVQSVLTQGKHGLPPDAEQRLTEAVMSGDDAKLISTSHVLMQRYPSYQKRIEDEYKALQEGGE